MAWSYSGNPATSPIDLTHFCLGDTDQNHPVASDEECYQALSDEGGNSYLAAAALAETKALQLMQRLVLTPKGVYATTLRSQAESFRLLAATLRAQASIRTTTLYAGGLSVVEHGADAAASDLPQPVFRMHLHEFPSITGAPSRQED